LIGIGRPIKKEKKEKKVNKDFGHPMSAINIKVNMGIGR
jgi:hypothetical protein